MKKFGLIGYPLGHSFSKKYFSEKFLNENIKDCQYESYPIENIDLLKDLISVNPELCGLNVTIPYKTAVFRYLDSIDEQAGSVGAVNVLKIKRSGGKTFVKGYNSDIDGFRLSLLPHMRNDVKSALVLGAGGAAKAVCYVLGNLGIKITSVDIVKKEGVIDYSEVTDRIVIDNKLIINTTPLGMFPNTAGKPEINYGLLGKEHILYDLVYNPELTSFLKEGVEHGSAVVSGLKMLHLQAERSWEIWNDDNL